MLFFFVVWASELIYFGSNFFLVNCRKWSPPLVLMCSIEAELLKLDRVISTSQKKPACGVIRLPGAFKPKVTWMFVPGPKHTFLLAVLRLQWSDSYRHHSSGSALGATSYLNPRALNFIPCPAVVPSTQTFLLLAVHL